MNSFLRGLSLLCALIFFLPLPARAEAPLRVVASLNPLARVVNSVAPEGLVRVETLLPPGVTPHDATLRPRQLQQLLEADLVLWLGPEAEPYLVSWLKKRGKPVIDVAALVGIKRLPRREEEPHAHGHHHEGVYDIHLWWSQENLRLAGNAVAAWLGEQRPAMQEALAQRQQRFAQELADLQVETARLQQAAPRYAVFHDGWQYFEADVGVKAHAYFVLDGEMSMGLRHLLALKKRLDDTPLDCIVLEPGMNAAMVHKLAPTTKLLMLDPLGWDAPGQGAVEMLRHAYRALQSCQQQGNAI